MAKYRKTALIEASQWFKPGDHPAVLMGEQFSEGEWHPFYFIDTMEGRLDVAPGTWIAGPGAKGEFWPIDDEVFAATYELVEDA